MARLYLTASLALALLAGCVTPPTTETADVEAASVATAQLGALMEATGEGAIGYLESYTMTHPFRIVHKAGPSDTMVKARDDLHKELEGFGLEVLRHEYSTSGTNILGIKRGTEKPDEWIVLSAHYDTTEETVYGAWDDGAGVAMLLELARAGAAIDFRHTVAFAFFDEEEQGLIGSKAFVAEYFGHVNFVANMNFDPPGLNWPCADANGPLPLKIIFDDDKEKNGTEGYAELKAAVLAGLDAAEVPDEVVDFSPQVSVATVNNQGRRGTSDHTSFNAVNVPNVFIGSLPVTHVGPASVLTYSLHTPLDTQAQMEARCGGADLLAQAFDVEISVVEVALAQLDAQ